ncbi:hypothetical protein [Pontibacter cellulosilyticus]|uniref:Uncharacterized protein n=1 Tax=Pontibacter cellulosilyticus TaxID=1720253 RepID=A0A923N542_9BACT|nr:hypothetical protein [Pontibacter cellulosilyticus]MBC5991902.1 hypothetical protein [Pontibacter cellulosilyticus]
MKKTVLNVTIILLTGLLACQESDDDVQEVLQNESERQEMYMAILDNEEMRNEMMEMMRERNMSGPMGRGGMMQGGMMGDTMRMGGMNRQQMQARMQEMMKLCETDTAACNTMAQTMLQHQPMMRNMMQHMQQQGMVDANCLQQMQRRMNR